MKIFLVAGARPNFMKIAPIVRALSAKSREQRAEVKSQRSEVRGRKSEGRGQKTNDLSWKIVHTGQHYDYVMSQAFFDDLEIPKPDFFLAAGSGSHAVQTAKIMVVCRRRQLPWVCRA